MILPRYKLGVWTINDVVLAMEYDLKENKLWEWLVL